METDMNASVVDIRYKMKEVLKAIRRNEEVRILYHGKPTAVILPLRKRHPAMRAEEHPLFGYLKGIRSRKSVEKIMEKLRGNRYSDLRKTRRRAV